MIAAAVVGMGCGALVLAGNPGNMGICGACFLRDTAGALGLFGSGPKIFRPELVGLVLGALAWVAATRGFVARSGSHAAARFFFGIWMAVGSLVFLGCPFRMLQRLGGGDLNAWIGLIGFVAGVGAGVGFEKRGYSVGKTEGVAAPIGWLGPLTFVGIGVLFLLSRLPFGPGPGDAGGPPHAVWWLALGIAVVAGALLSATGFCAITAARQVFVRGKLMLVGAGALVVAYGGVVFVGGQGHVGLEGQPAAHGDALWSIASLALVGLAGCLAGGCPVRQMVMTGEGNGDAFVTVAGLVVGGALAHNFGLVSSGDGSTTAGRWAVSVGLLIALLYPWIVLRVGARGQ
ncbi:MAG: YedE family putative selenium transporter [Planctomycetota bacterium]